jgi:hypothetical protein
MSTAVFSIAINLFHAEAMIGQLMMEGFSIHAVSLLLAHKNGKRDFMNELNAETRHGIARGGVGCILDGSLAGLGEVCALGIPGKGSYMAVGPIMSALSGSFLSRGGIDLSDTLVALLGVPATVAQCYEQSIRGGCILVCIQADDMRECERAAQVFQRYEAGYITTSSAAACV